MSNIGIKSGFGDQIMAQLRDMQTQARESNNRAAGQQSSSNGPSFMDHLKDGVKEVNEMQKSSDKMASDVAAGKSQNLQETMLAATQAELSFNLMVQVRNRVLEAYQEVMRMPV